MITPNQLKILCDEGYKNACDLLSSMQKLKTPANELSNSIEDEIGKTFMTPMNRRNEIENEDENENENVMKHHRNKLDKSAIRKNKNVVESLLEKYNVPEVCDMKEEYKYLGMFSDGRLPNNKAFIMELIERGCLPEDVKYLI